MILHVHYNANREMDIARKKRRITKDKRDFDQGMRCLAHVITEVHLRKEMARLIGEKTIQEDNNGDG